MCVCVCVQNFMLGLVASILSGAQLTMLLANPELHEFGTTQMSRQVTKLRSSGVSTDTQADDAPYGWELRYNSGGRLRAVPREAPKMHVVLVRCDEPVRPVLRQLETLSGHMTFTIYQKQSARCGRNPLPSPFPVKGADVRVMPGNLGRECSGILQFLYDEYHKLASHTAFMQWGAEVHMPLSLSLTLLALQNGSGGFVALSKNSFEGFWPAPCEPPEQAKALRTCANEYWRTAPPSGAMREPPTRFRFYANGLFAVAPERVQAHPRSYYKRLLDRMLGRAPLACVGGPHHLPFAPWVNASGFVRAEADCLMLEKTWHIIFGESPTLAPPEVYNLWRYPMAWRQANLQHPHDSPRATRIKC